MRKINKKADMMYNIVILLIITLVSIVIMFNILSRIFDQTEEFSESGYLCLATLKMKDFFSADDTTLGIKMQVNMFKDRCSTINNVLEVQRKNVPKPINETTKINALSKKIADRMGYVWWMTGQGNLKNLLNDETAKLEIFGSALTGKVSYDKGIDAKIEGDQFPCITFMNFEIDDSDYFPQGYNTFYLIDYMRNNDYSIEQKGGQKYTVTYYDYITSFSSEGNGGLFIAPSTRFVPGETYSIAIMQPPKDGGWIDSLFDCAVPIALGVGVIGATVATGGIAGVMAAGAVGVSASVGSATVLGGVGFLGGSAAAIYGGDDSFASCFGDDQHDINLAIAESFETGALYHKMNFEDYKFQDKFFMLVGPQDDLKNIGCVEIKSGVQG